MGRHIAIVGNYPPTRDLANGLSADEEIWGCSETYRHLNRITRYFEMHEDAMKGMEYPADYYDWLREGRVPIYTIWYEPSIPTSTPYPLENILNAQGDYLSSSPAYLMCSVAYMLALAIYESVELIELYGVDTNPPEGSSYAKTLPCIYYFIGMARGKGIPVLIHTPVEEVALA
jgi:hypothetical protein